MHKMNTVENGVPKGVRTPVAAVKGQCPRPLDDGDTKLTIRHNTASYLVELAGIEPATSCMPCKRSPELSYSPKKLNSITFLPYISISLDTVKNET